WARRDVPAALRAVAQTTRVTLIGHSAGGAAILAALAAHAELRVFVNGIVVLATPVPWLQGWRKIASRTFRRAALLLGRFPARRLPHAGFARHNLPRVWQGGRLLGGFLTSGQCRASRRAGRGVAAHRRLARLSATLQFDRLVRVA